MTEQQWTDLELYVLREHIEDFEDGIISRRELLRRVTLFTGSLAATLVLLPALGCNIDRPAPAAASPAATAAPATTAPTPTATPAPATPAVAYATPPPARTTDGVTVQPDDPRITAGPAEVKGPDGASLIGYLARPKADGKYAGVLVVHENRGTTAHIKDVVRRVATAGFVGLSIDLLSREGGADKIEGGAYSAQLARRTPEALVADLRAALVHLRGLPFASGKLGAVGFCFGGGMVLYLLPANATAVLDAAAPFYGPPPSDLSVLATTKAAVFGVYAEQDTRITGSRPQIEEELKKGGRPFETAVYPGAGHGFHNDTGGDRYNPEQSRRAWVATIEWFRRYLV